MISDSLLDRFLAAQVLERRDALPKETGGDAGPDGLKYRRVRARVAFLNTIRDAECTPKIQVCPNHAVSPKCACMRQFRILAELAFERRVSMLFSQQYALAHIYGPQHPLFGVYRGPATITVFDPDLDLDELFTPQPPILLSAVRQPDHVYGELPASREPLFPPTAAQSMTTLGEFCLASPATSEASQDMRDQFMSALAPAPVIAQEPPSRRVAPAGYGLAASRPVPKRR